MEVRDLELTEFRNYERVQVHFCPGVNVVIGRNGQGKTNLVEAVYLLSAMGSYRGGTHGVLVRHGAERAVVRAVGWRQEREVRMAVEVGRLGGIRVLVNRVPLQRVKQAEGLLTAVLFSPEDLALVKGGPEQRRRFLDHAVVRGRPGAAARSQDFERVLRQRNGVLKAAQANPRALRSLDVWDEQFVRIGVDVVESRLVVLDRLRPAAQRRHRDLGSDKTLELWYRVSWERDGPLVGRREDIERELEEALREVRDREIERGVSIVGPHRDDLGIELGGVNARAFASQGEQRTVALALRLGERDVQAEISGENPILLLDDVFSELDEQRREQLGALLIAPGQAIVTATGPSGLPVAGERVLEVEAGKVWER